MLFDQQFNTPKEEVRPALPKDFQHKFEIGFLFNFVSSKSTRFDLEPVLIFENNGKTEYRRISLNAEKGLAFLHMLDDDFYKQLLEFSDNKILEWMTRTGNKFIRNHSGSWAHASVRELQNLRKHYLDLLKPLWPKLQQWPNFFVLKAGKFNNFKQQNVKLGSEVSFSIEAELKGELILLKLNIFIDGKDAEVKVRGGFLLDDDTTLYLPPDREALAIIDQFRNETLSFPVSVKKEVISKFLLPWIGKYDVSIGPKLNVYIVSPDPKARILLSELNESNLMIRPQFQYGESVVDYSDASSFVDESGDKIRIVNRNKEQEKALYEYLRTLHSSFSNQRNNQYYYLPFDQVMKKGWFITMLRNVQDQGYTIHGWEDLKKFRYTTHEPRFTISAISKEEHFDLNVQIHWGGQEANLKEVRHAILNGQDTIMLDDGTLGHIPDEWISQYSLLLRTASEENGMLRINKIHYMLLEDILDKIEDKTVRQEIESRKNKLLQFDTRVEKRQLSSEIKASLRPYQESGFNWLQSLDDLGWGGCLADDMGLGKTLQTISFLQFLKDKYPGSTQLVICPTSLIFNWENELTKFCPTLKFHIHYGVQREFSETHFNDYDVVLTSYGVVRNDIEQLNNFLWQYIILDESQAIKNPDARVTKAMQQLRSVNRLILSGTPVQNNTSDLFSQFNFVNPGLLGSREYFNRVFATPIDKFGSKEKTHQLQKLIHPFTLRRTKEQVAKDLPDKTITVLWCTMEAEQRNLYNQHRDGYRKKLLKKIDEEGITKSGMDVLEGLLRLRQICDHPRLVNKTADGDLSSVKVDELIREVTENTGNHKLLIFSQFTGMLGLIRNEFEKNAISYCYLDGSTSLNQRKEEVTRFQEDETVKAFLISLKAGGVGLNLTVADYVYIVDPWWNPAAEMQAIDRAHRIGQARKELAYKMICKDTVEERILQMQERKKKLADDLIQEDAGFVKNLSREDIEFLFG